MNVLVVTAFGAEYQTLWALLEDRQSIITKDQADYAVTVGKLFDVPATLIVTGMGKENFQKSLRHFFSFETSFTGAIKLGFCGGISHSAKVGTLTVPDRIQLESGEKFSPSQDLKQKIAKQLYDEDREFLIGDMLTVDRIITTVEERKLLNSKTSAVTVDMESAYFAQICNEKKLPWFVAKTVMDDLTTKDFNRDALKPGLELAKSELLKCLPTVFAEIKKEWDL